VNAHQVIADAAAAVIKAAMVAEGIAPEAADRIARRAVRDLRRDGWHITAQPLPHPHPLEADR
jgi:hypothetical protein